MNNYGIEPTRAAALLSGIAKRQGDYNKRRSSHDTTKYCDDSVDIPNM
jgi:hypothetical protein